MIYYDNKKFTKQITYEVYLLKKYLTKHYNEKKAKALIKSKQDDLLSLAKSLGAIDIAFFCEYFLRDIFIVQDNNEARTLSKSHYEMWQLLNEAFVEDKYDKLNILAPRGWAKSTTCDLALSIWAICYKKSLFTVVCAKTDIDAQQFIFNIKARIVNDYITNAFGLLLDKSRKDLKINANETEFTNGTSLRAISSGTSMRGINFKSIRPQLIIADDMDSEANILTEDARNKQYNKWTKELEPCGDKAVYRNGKKIKLATKIVSIGTVLHIDGLVSRLARNKDYKTFLRQAIILEPEQTVDDIFDSDLWLQCKRLYFNDKDEDSKRTANEYYLLHKSEMKFPILWEEKWDCFNDIAIPFWENRTAFMSEMQNDATSIGTKWFKSVRTEPKSYIENNSFIKTALVIDPATTTNANSDFTAMCVCSETNNNNFMWVRDIVLDKFEFNSYCQNVVDKLIEWEEITHIVIEKNSYQGADVSKIKELIAKEPKLKNRRFEFINKMQRENKDQKISIIIDPVNNGQIIFIDNNQEAIEQLMSFCGQKYSQKDDFPDCVAEGYIKLKEIAKPNKITLLSRDKLF